VGKLVKIILSIIAVMVLLIVIAIFTLPFFIDPNSFKPDIVAAVKGKTGRDLTLTGDLKLSIFPSLSISTGKIVLGNPAGFQEHPFATMEESDIKVKLLPLLSKKIEVSRIVLKGLILNLAKNSEGVSNWDDLLASYATKTTYLPPANNTGEQNKPRAMAAALAIGGITLENAQINWDNQQSEKYLLKKGTFTVSELQLNLNDVTLTAELTGNVINDRPSFQGPVTIATFNPTKALQKLGIAVPVMQDTNVFSKSTINFDLLETENSVDLQNLAMSLDDTKIKGSARITDYALPVITFNLAADAMDIDRYLPPVTDKSSKPVISPAVALATGTVALPVEILKKLNIDGQLSLDRLRINGLAMQDIQLNLSAKDGIIKMQQSIKEFYQGSYSSSLSVDMYNKKPALTINEKIMHVQVEPLLMDFKGEAQINGVVDALAQLQGQGNSADELKSALNGSVSFLFKDSAVKGFNLQNIIDQAKALIKDPAAHLNNNKDQTLFSEITGTATINNGLIQNNDLVATASRIHINGKGNADLNTERLDYKINAKFINAEATAKEPQQVNDIAINISVGGTISKPTYTLDVAALLTDKDKAQIESLIDKNQGEIDSIVNNLPTLLTDKNKAKIEIFIDKNQEKIDKKLGTGAGDSLKELFKKQ